MPFTSLTSIHAALHLGASYRTGSAIASTPIAKQRRIDESWRQVLIHFDIDPVRPRTMVRRSVWIAIVMWVVFSGCARRVPPPATSGSTPILEVREGLASYYAEAFHGKITASGRPFDMNALVAAHPHYPLGTLLRVTNLANGRSINVRIQDRGPARRPQSEGV